MLDIAKRNSFFPEPEEVPEEWRLSPVEQKEYLIGGELREWNGPFSDVYSPVFVKVDGEERPFRLGSYPEMNKAAVLEVLEAARTAYDYGRGLWPTMSMQERISCLQKLLKGLKEQGGEIVKMLMWEIGKNHSESQAELDRTIEYIEDTLNAASLLEKQSRNVEVQGIYARVGRGPLGVVLCMGPYNYPLNETFATLIPALVMGNTVIFRPARFGILLIRSLLPIFRDAFPPGVMNVIYGDGEQTAGSLMESGKVDVLAFIGSSRVANILKRQHPFPSRLRSVLGLDAKNPAVILPDADIDSTVAECVNGALAFNGQRCTALKLIFVHESIIDEFTAKFSAKVNTLKAGLPWEEDVSITPLPEPGKPLYLQELINDAVSKGARVVNDGGGEFYKSIFFPAVLYPVTPAMRIYHEEQFGPVVPIIPFSDLAEILTYIVGSNYGQQISIFSSNPDLIGPLLDPLVNQVCRVNINTKCQRGPDVFPFTGRKDSAEGTLSVEDALKVFSIRTMVATRSNDNNINLLSKIQEAGTSKFLSS